MTRHLAVALSITMAMAFVSPPSDVEGQADPSPPPQQCSQWDLNNTYWDLVVSMPEGDVNYLSQLKHADGEWVCPHLRAMLPVITRMSGMARDPSGYSPAYMRLLVIVLDMDYRARCEAGAG